MKLNIMDTDFRARPIETRRLRCVDFRAQDARVAAGTPRDARFARIPASTKRRQTRTASERERLDLRCSRL